MRPEPYRHLEERPRLRRPRRARARGGRPRREHGRPRARLGCSAERRPSSSGPRRPEHLGPVREALVAHAVAGGARGSRLALHLMAILVLNQSEVEQLLDMDGCIEAMAGILESLARGELYQPLRSIAFPPGESSVIGLMPAHRAGGAAAYSLKTICLFPDNPTRGLDAHQGTVTLFSGTTGEVRALMNASAITAIRTAAVSAVATAPARPRGRARARDPRRGRAGALAHRGDARGPSRSTRIRIASRDRRARRRRWRRRPARRRSRAPRRPCAAPTSSSPRRSSSEPVAARASG